MPSESVEAIGAAQLAYTLTRAAHELDQGVGGADAEAAQLVASSARGLAPRRTGALAASVRAEGPTVYAGSAFVQYAPFVEYGTPSRGIPARPFMTDAAKTSEPMWVQVFRRGIARVLSKIKGA